MFTNTSESGKTMQAFVFFPQSDAGPIEFDITTIEEGRGILAVDGVDKILVRHVDTVRGYCKTGNKIYDEDGGEVDETYLAFMFNLPGRYRFGHDVLNAGSKKWTICFVETFG